MALQKLGLEKSITEVSRSIVLTAGLIAVRKRSNEDLNRFLTPALKNSLTIPMFID